MKKIKEYPCKKSKSGLCEYGGNKFYNYGFLQGSASYCRKAKAWVADIECPLIHVKSAKEGREGK